MDAKWIACILFLFFKLHLIAQNYLVTKKGDSIFIKGTPKGNHKNPCNWTRIKANDTTFKIFDIKCILIDQNFYLNVHNRKLWKRVIKGNLKIYARNDKDTIWHKRRGLEKVLYIQKDKNEFLYKYNYFNLIKIIEQDSIIEISQQKINQHYGGKTMMIVGIVNTSFTAVALLSAYIVALPRSIPSKALYRAGIFFISSIGNIFSSILIQNNAKKLSLNPVHFYNSLLVQDTDSN